MAKMTLNDLKQELTAEELHELEEAEKKEPVFDGDSPLMMKEQLMQFKYINHQNRTKPTISLRISAKTLKRPNSTERDIRDFSAGCWTRRLTTRNWYVSASDHLYTWNTVKILLTNEIYLIILKENTGNI